MEVSYLIHVICYIRPTKTENQIKCHVMTHYSIYVFVPARRSPFASPPGSPYVYNDTHGPADAQGRHYV